MLTWFAPFAQCYSLAMLMRLPSFANLHRCTSTTCAVLEEAWTLLLLLPLLSFSCSLLLLSNLTATRYCDLHPCTLPSHRIFLVSVCGWLHHRSHCAHTHILVLALSRGICSKLANLLALSCPYLYGNILHSVSAFISLQVCVPRSLTRNCNRQQQLQVDLWKLMSLETEAMNEWMRRRKKRKRSWNEATRMTRALLFPFARIRMGRRAGEGDSATLSLLDHLIVLLRRHYSLLLQLRDLMLLLLLLLL